MSQKTAKLGAITLAIVGIPERTWGSILDVVQKLASDGEEFATDLKKFVKEWKKATAPAAKGILALLFAGEELSIRSLDGSRTIARAKSIFSVYIDSDFKNWKLDVSGKATDQTLAEVHEMQSNATFAEMFGSLGRSIHELCFTQDQIIEFCDKHRSQLRSEGYATFFLFEENGEYFVAIVGVFPVGLDVDVYRFGYSRVWRGDSLHRIVVPQQTT